MTNQKLKINIREKMRLGQILMEIILVIGIVAAILALSGELILVSFRTEESIKRKGAALNLLQQSIESLRAVRDFDDSIGTYGLATQGWNRIYLPPDGNGDSVSSKGSANPYHIEIVSGKAVLVSGLENITLNNVNFIRKIIIENISRDPATGMIESVYNPSNNDPTIQKITVIISQENMEDMAFTQYISRFRNDVCAQTNWSGGALAIVTSATLLNCQSFIYYDSITNLDTSGASLKLVQ